MHGTKPEPVPVKTGLTDGTFTEIVSGEVNEGDAVVLEATNPDDPSGAQSRPPGAPGGQQPRMRL